MQNSQKQEQAFAFLALYFFWRALRGIFSNITDRHYLVMHSSIFAGTGRHPTIKKIYCVTD